MPSMLSPSAWTAALWMLIGREPHAGVRARTLSEATALQQAHLRVSWGVQMCRR